MARHSLAALVLVVAACRDTGDASTMHVTGTTGDGATSATSTTTTTTTSSTSTSSASGTTTGEASSSTTSTATTDAVDSSTSSGSSTTTTTGDGTTTTTTSGGTTEADPVATCLEMVDPGDECMACICTDCMSLWDNCHADEGCSMIQECAQNQGCYNLDCLGPCQTTINFWGGAYGTSFMELWYPLSTCLWDSCWGLCPW